MEHVLFLISVIDFLLLQLFEGGSSAIKFSWSVCIFVILLVLVV
jgi:hypothetical protein